MPDSQLGEQLGVSADAVRYHKYKLGIPSWQAQAPKIQWTPEMETLLGTLPDEDVSVKLDISRWSVVKRRAELGIPSWQEQQTPTIRRQRELELLNTLTLEQWLFACSWFNNCCAYCGQEIFLTKDHLVPVKKRGPRTVFNIIPACWSCNNSKRAQRAHLWIYKRFGIEEGQRIVDRIVRYLTEVSSRWS
jgi:5-methylcytosine-specific restriction endonuclease McrA